MPIPLPLRDDPRVTLVKRRSVLTCDCFCDRNNIKQIFLKKETLQLKSKIYYTSPQLSEGHRNSHIGENELNKRIATPREGSNYDIPLTFV